MKIFKSAKLSPKIFICSRCDINMWVLFLFYVTWENVGKILVELQYFIEIFVSKIWNLIYCLLFVSIECDLVTQLPTIQFYSVEFNYQTFLYFVDIFNLIILI